MAVAGRQPAEDGDIGGVKQRRQQAGSDRKIEPHRESSPAIRFRA
jgi:hypothetical protein